MYTYSSFFLFLTEFSNHMYRKNGIFIGKQKQMKPLLDDLDVKLDRIQLTEIFGDGFLSDQDVIRLQNFISLKYCKVTGSTNVSGCSLNELKQSMARLQQNKANGERSISTCLAELDNSTGLPR